MLFFKRKASRGSIIARRLGKTLMSLDTKAFNELYDDTYIAFMTLSKGLNKETDGLAEAIVEDEDYLPNLIAIGERYRSPSSMIGTYGEKRESTFINLDQDFPLTVTSFESWNNFPVLQTILDHCLERTDYKVYVASFQNTFQNYANDSQIEKLVNLMGGSGKYRDFYENIIIPLSDAFEQRKLMTEDDLKKVKPIMFIIEDLVIFNEFIRISYPGITSDEANKVLELIENIFQEGNGLNIKIASGLGLGWVGWNDDKSMFNKVKDSVKTKMIFPHKVKYPDLFSLADPHSKAHGESHIDALVDIKRRPMSNDSCAILRLRTGINAFGDPYGDVEAITMTKQVDTSMRLIPG